jgi:sugar lactone lactonase YvrE
MRKGDLILLSMLGSVGSVGLLSCSGKRLHIGDDGAGGGHAGSSGQAGATAGAAGSSTPSGSAGSGGAGVTGLAGNAPGGATGAGGTGGATGAGGTGGVVVDGNLSVNPGSATFTSTLVEATSTPQTFTVRNEGTVPAAPAAAFQGTNAADFLITSNGCGATLQPGASCEIAVAFAPKTRSGSRTASLAVGAPASVSLSGNALPSLGLLAGGLGGPGNVDGTGAAARFMGPGGIVGDGAGNLYAADGYTIRKVVIASGTVTTFAGAAGQPGSADGTGTAARFYGTSGIATDGAGNLYVSDSNNYTIRKVVIATGVVTTFAGAAAQSGSADGTGASARFSYPNSITSDGAGNLYVSDGQTIRKVVITTRAVTTFAGAAAQSGSADGTGASARFSYPNGIATDGAGNLYVSDSNNYTIRKVVIATRAVTTLAGAAGQNGSTEGTGATARFNGPAGIATDGAGNLYVTESYNNTVRKVVIATGAVTTFAGAPRQYGSADGVGTAARFNSLGSIATDGAGNLYVADYGTLRKVTIATAAVTTLAGAAGPFLNVGPSLADRFNNPADVATDGAGNLYVADTQNSVIRKVVIATGALTTLAGGSFQVAGADGTGAGASFLRPGGIATDGAGNLYVADTENDTIRKIVIATGTVTTLAGTAGQAGSADGTGAAARFSWPHGIASDGMGNLYVADTTTGAIRKVVIATGAVTTLASGFVQPDGIAVDGAGNLFVSETRNGTIRKVVIATGAATVLAGTDGQSGYADGTGADARFTAPWGLAIDGAGNLFVGDASNNAIRKIVLATGAVTTVAGLGGWRMYGYADGTGVAARFAGPVGIALDGTGNLYVADGGNNAVRKVDVATRVVTTVAGGPAPIGSTDGTGANARFTRPTGIASDGAGNIYVTDWNATVRKVVIATKAVTTFAGAATQQANVDGTLLDARFFSPNALHGDGLGSLYVADATTIRKVALATGAVVSLAGTPNSSGYKDATGADAFFAGPTGVASDGMGNIYVADAMLDTCNCVRKVVVATGAVTTLAGNYYDVSVDGTGTDARFTGPRGIAGDGAGNLYVTDSATIRKVVIATGVVTTFAGTSSETGSADGIGPGARFMWPTGIASDGAGNLYVVDGTTIRKIVIATATVSTVIGSPTSVGVSPGALPASLNQPRGVAVLPTGELAIVDYAENAVLIGHL